MPTQQRVARSAGPRTPTTPEGAKRTDRLGAALERAQREVLTVSVWAERGLPAGESTAVVRLQGRRLDIEGKPGPADRFVREETVVLPERSGPFSLSVRIDHVNPGTWSVKAEMLPGRTARAAAGRRATAKPLPLELVSWSWRHWRRPAAPAEHVQTGTALLARRPGIVPAGWAMFVFAGIIAGLLLQAGLASSRSMSLGAVYAVSSAAVIAGAVGAKAWYLLLERRRGRWDGWAVQGFVAGMLLVVLVLVPLVGLGRGAYLDVTAAPLLLGMAVGRLGCFVAGCCGGRPTCARHGVWSSDRRIGVRRVPTQLAESLLALVVAAASYVLVTRGDPATEGAVFLAGVAAYTLGRQVVLRYRAEARHTTIGSRLTTVAAALALAVGLLGIWR